MELKFAYAYVEPLGIMMDGSAVPMLVDEDDRLMVVSCCALAGLLLTSCN